MAISAAFVWEVRTDGNDANGGGFKTGASGTDRSQQAAAHVTIDGATITAVVHTTTTQLNITGYTVIAGDVGNCVNINGGTATAGRYEITAVDTGNNRWTLDRSAGTAAQTATGRMGGCLATPGQLGVILSTANQGAEGQVCWVKSGTYTITTATLGSGGPFKNTAIPSVVEGYQTTRGDRAARPVLHAGAITNVVLWWQSFGNYGAFICLEADGNNGTGNKGFSHGYTQGEYILCKAINCSATSCYGFGTVGNAKFCGTNNCYIGFSSLASCLKCYALSSVNDGFNAVSSAIACIAKSSGNDGFLLVAATNNTAYCVADGSTRYGFNIVGNSSITECVAINHSGAGDRGFSMNGRSGIIHCAGYNNATNYTGGTFVIVDNFITLSADPFIDAANGDYRPNNTAGGGALLRGTGIGVFGQTDNMDLSAVQAASGSSSGSRLVGPSGLVGRAY